MSSYCSTVVQLCVSCGSVVSNMVVGGSGVVHVWFIVGSYWYGLRLYGLVQMFVAQLVYYSALGQFGFSWWWHDLIWFSCCSACIQV